MPQLQTRRSLQRNVPPENRLDDRRSSRLSIPGYAMQRQHVDVDLRGQR